MLHSLLGGGSGSKVQVAVVSRTIIWSLVKQMRVLLVPILHGLHRRLALEC
jgi:hypothetical protein